MSEPFMFTDAPQQPKHQAGEELQQNAEVKPVRKPPPRAVAVDDDLDIVMQMAAMLKARDLKSRIRIIAALTMILDT